jgi:hypothetical protein
MSGHQNIFDNESFWVEAIKFGNSLSVEEKIAFLAHLAHDLTVAARGTYVPGTESVAKPESLRAYNEVQHRVTASLRDYFVGYNGMPLDAVLDMLKEFGVRQNETSHIKFAICAARKLTEQSRVGKLK